MSIVDRPVDKPVPRAAPVDLSTALGPLQLPNPVLTASGCAAAGRELAPFFDPAELGAVTTKSVQLLPRSGRATPRMAETASGMLNSIGLQGPGIEAFCEHDLPWLAERGARAVVSIAGSTVDEYAELAGRLRGAAGVAAVEVNISCPNVEDRGQVFACDPDAAARVVAAVRRESSPLVPVLAKLSPDVTDIVAIARSCVAAGADGLSLVNTLLGLVIDPDTQRPALAGRTGGLSGPAIRPVAVRCVWQVHAALPAVPIVGMGGIMTGLDALQFVLAGASAVAVGTAIFHDPKAPVRILAELRDALTARGFRRLADAVGYAHRAPDAPDEHRPRPAADRRPVHRLLSVD
ncbi:MAG: dihydroorotate dehydrogenase catalytic subunit [Mycobacteriales bacterium]